MKKTQIAFFDTKPYDRQFFDIANQKHNFIIHYFESRLNPDSAALAKGFDAVCAFVNDDVSTEVVNKLAELGIKLIVMRCAGFNNVDLNAANAHGITVARVPAYSPHAVAEYTLGLILALNRHLPKAYNRVRDGNFTINGLLGFDLYGKTIGVVGTGKIGKTFIELLQGFGMNVLAYDPHEDQDLKDRKLCTYVPLTEIFEKSDIISLHCPLSPENMHMINHSTIAQMKKGVMLVNTSRGKLIDTSALIDALKARKLSGAALDVYEEEAGYFFEDNSAGGIADDILARLLTFPNVLVTSHQAFFTVEALTNISDITLQNVKDFEDGISSALVLTQKRNS